MVRLFICRRDGDTEANALRHCSHGRDHSQGLMYRPLRAGDDSRIQRAGIDIVTTCETAFG